MCKSLIEGGQRCASHTGKQLANARAALEKYTSVRLASGLSNSYNIKDDPEYQAHLHRVEEAEWEYASTPTGAAEYAQRAEETFNRALMTDDIEEREALIRESARLDSVVARGQRIRQGNQHLSSVLADHALMARINPSAAYRYLQSMGFTKNPDMYDVTPDNASEFLAKTMRVLTPAEREELISAYDLDKPFEPLDIETTAAGLDRDACEAFMAKRRSLSYSQDAGKDDKDRLAVARMLDELQPRERQSFIEAHGLDGQGERGKWDPVRCEANIKINDLRYRDERAVQDRSPYAGFALGDETKNKAMFDATVDLARTIRHRNASSRVPYDADYVQQKIDEVVTAGFDDHGPVSDSRRRQVRNAVLDTFRDVIGDEEWYRIGMKY